jgi:hypothetical protein
VTGTLRVFRAELYRLLRGRTTWIALVCVVGLASLRVVAAHVATAAAHARAVQDALISGRPVPPVPEAGNAFAPLVEGWLVGLTVGTLLLLIFSARTLAGDRESGVLRLARTRSASRGALVFGRFLLGPPLVLALVAASGLGAWATSAWLFDFGPLVEDGYELLSMQELMDELQIAVVAAIPPLIATYAFGLFISALGRSATGAVGLCLAVFLGFDLFKEVIGDGQVWVFATFVPSLVDKSCLHEMAGIAHGYSDSGYPDEVLRMNHLMPWPQAAALIAATCLIVRRRSL